MKKLTAVFFLSLVSIGAFAQDNSKATVPYRSFITELGGPGVLFSVNYDTRFKKQSFGWGGRIGVGFTTSYRNNSYYDPALGGYVYVGEGKNVSALTVPVQLNYLFGKEGSKSALEVGGGATYVGRKAAFLNFEDRDGKASVYGNASFMYRRMPTNGGFSWRVGFTPLIGDGFIQPSAAASVGFNF